MATRRRPTTSRRTAPRRRTATAAAELLARLPALEATQREAFRGQIDDARCLELGRRTRGRAVVTDAHAFAGRIEAALRQQGGRVGRYGADRLAWLLECVVRLEEALAAAREVRGEPGPRAEVAVAEARAAAARSDLQHALELMAGAHASALDEVARAAGAAEDLAGSLAALARLADRWLARTDEASQALAASVGLARAEATAATRLAEELRAALARAAGAPPRTDRDPASVNLAEGRVLFELRVAMRAFAHAHARDPGVPRLLPGPATRALLGRHDA